jgi:hypothetical protein
MPMENVAAAFELLIEALADVSNEIDRDGAEAFKQGRHNEVQSLLRKVRAVGDFEKTVNELLEKWLKESGLDIELETQPTTREPSPDPIAGELALQMKYKDAEARGNYRGGSVMLLAGSTVRRPILDSLSDTLREMRKQRERDGTLVSEDHPDLLRLTNAINFGSPSAAAQFVAGCSVSGNRDWHVETTKIPLGKHLRRHSDKNA